MKIDITLIETAGNSLSTVHYLESMIANIDGLCGNGISTAGNRKNGSHSDPTFQTALKLERLRKELLAESKIAARNFIAAEEELKTVDDLELRKILYYRHLMNLSWHEVAKELGSGNTSDMVKQKHSRFVRRLKRTMATSVSPTEGGATVCC